MRKLKVGVAAILVTVAALTLTGCNETLTERTDAKNACEASGGRYYEYSSFIGTYWYNTCVLSTN